MIKNLDKFAFLSFGPFMGFVNTMNTHSERLFIYRTLYAFKDSMKVLLLQVLFLL